VCVCIYCKKSIFITGGAVFWRHSSKYMILASSFTNSTSCSTSRLAAPDLPTLTRTGWTRALLANCWICWGIVAENMTVWRWPCWDERKRGAETSREKEKKRREIDTHKNKNQNKPTHMHQKYILQRNPLCSWCLPQTQGRSICRLRQEPGI